MQLGIINSAYFDTPLDGKAGLEHIKATGFDVFDIFADPLALSDAERAQFVEDVRGAGLPVVSNVCVALGIADFNPTAQRFHVDRAKAHADLIAEVGGQNLLLVLGEYLWQREVIPADDQFAMAANATREVGEHAASLGVEVAIELEPFHASLVRTVDDMVRFLELVNHDAVRANIDCSHLWLTRTDASEIAKLAGKIAHCHISDCDGVVHGDLPPGRGNTPLASYIAALRDAGFEGAVSLELEYSPEPDKIGEWVVEAYAATDRLMRDAGVRTSAVNA